MSRRRFHQRLGPGTDTERLQECPLIEGAEDSRPGIGGRPPELAEIYVRRQVRLSRVGQRVMVCMALDRLQGVGGGGGVYVYIYMIYL